MLIIGSTDMDSQRPMIWSMSSIAASKHPDALKRFCKVLLASASIPVLFPPVLFDVHANGEKHDEMHIYSGVTSQVLLYPAAFRFQSLTDTAAAKRRREIFILRNGRLGPNHEPIERKLLPVAVRSTAHLPNLTARATCTESLWAANATGWTSTSPLSRTVSGNQPQNPLIRFACRPCLK